MTSQMSRLIAIGLLMLTLATGAAQAAPRNLQVQPSSHVETTSFASRLRHWLVVLTQQLLPPGAGLLKEGVILDPNGQH